MGSSEIAGFLDNLKNRIDIFCKRHVLDGNTFDVAPKEFGKIIHDTTWKTNLFESHEIEIINSRLFQRLRYISQMGFVDYVYPAARHSRFEHSLGVTILASKMMEAVCRKENSENSLEKTVQKSIRLSALLHDVGHCFFSHSSELVYGIFLSSSELIDEIFKESKTGGPTPSPHELLSYLIITSNSFRSYFEKLRKKYEQLKDLDIDEIALRIVGRIKDNNEKKRYQTSFINGPIDADKLDYFHRDSQFSGIPIQLDLDRLLYEINISKIPYQAAGAIEIQDLTVSTSGISCIEQIIFNKMILYSTIYTHHKVEAIDCMFRGVFEYIIENSVEIDIGEEHRKIESVADFLYFLDFDLFKLGFDEGNHPILKELIENIKYRKLLKRALEINRRTIERNPGRALEIPDIVRKLKAILDLEESGNDLKENVQSLYKELSSPSLEVSMSGIIKMLSPKGGLQEKQEYLRKLASEICKKAGLEEAKYRYQIWIDIARVPRSEETQSIMIRSRRKKSEKTEEYVSIDKYYPFAQYKDLYENNRLNAHVFGPPEHIDEIAKAAKTVLEKELKITFRESAIFYPQ